MRVVLIVLIRLLALFGLLFSVVCARDNPFEPIIKPNENTFKNDIGKNYFKDKDFKLPSTARILKEITIKYQNIDGSIETKTIPIDESIDWHYPLLLTQSGAIISDEKRNFVIKPFKFFTQGNKFYLYTSADIMRSFVLPSPYRIVLDIARGKPESNRTIDLHTKYFSKASVSTHKDFYRFVITLDGQYSYDISKERDHYIISLQ